MSAAALTLTPNAKVNLGLHITGRRADGYHLLETAFWPVHELHDVLTLERIEAATPTLEIVGMEVQGNLMDNLVLRAWRALRVVAPTVPAVHIRLEKRIPAGAGLGGGSSDAAHTLAGLNRLFQLGLASEQLRALALPLGADVPFFIENKPMLATGVGEVLSPLALDLSAYRFELVTPPVHSDTREAYRHLRPEHWSGDQALGRLLQRPVAEWRDSVRNDFEPSVFARYPELAAIKQQLYDRGAVYAAMSGSGSALFGLFPVAHG